jgi:penicillin-binding protein A
VGPDRATSGVLTACHDMTIPRRRLRLPCFGAFGSEERATQLAGGFGLMGRRIRWLGVVLIICFGLVLAQLVNIQFRRASALANAPDNPRNLATHYDNNRGQILASDGTVLAQSLPVTNPCSTCYQYQRTYPQGSLFSQIVGYSSIFYGTSGIEQQYNSYLVPHSNSAQSLSQLLNPPKPTTDNVSLTIEPSLQKVAQQALAATPGANKDGAVVAIDPSTGAILAMYSSPTFDPNPLVSQDIPTEQAAWNAYNTKDAEGFRPLRPIATEEFFNPGSTSKVVTSAGVYNLAPQLSNFYVPVQACYNPPQTNKQICNDGTDVTNSDPCGGTMADMLPPSCDPGYAQLGVMLGGTLLAQQADEFGYNSVPPLDLPNVIASNFPTAAQLSTSGSLGSPGTALSAIGQQDVETTALQNALVAAGIANGGVIMTPHLLSQVHDSQGNVVTSYQPKPWQRPVSQATAGQITSLMEAVAQYGTASGIFSPSLQVAVKTGTAQSGLGNNNDWMIGFAPASNPQIAVAVVVPQQAIESDGAGVAGPIMDAMLTAALSH